MERAFQKIINRMARASLGVLPSTPVAFLQAEGWSLPAQARLDRRQSSFATRLASAPQGPHRDIFYGRTGIGERLREALGQAAVGTVKRSTLSQGRAFPGTVDIPPAVSGEDKKKMIEAAVEEARGFERDPDTIWTDGSRLASGGVGGAIAWYEEVTVEEDAPPFWLTEEEC